MKHLDEASTGRTYERAGAQFICSSADGCDITLFSQPKPVRTLAGDLLEETGAWRMAIRDLPPEYEIPQGVVTAVEQAYHAALAWVEFLDRAAKEG